VDVRRYRPSDRAAIRRIAFDTALYGRPIRECVADERLVADSLILYYVRFEPELLLVAEESGEVAGYLTGCRDTRTYLRTYARHVTPVLLTDFVRGGDWLRARSWRAVTAAVPNGFRWARARGSIPDDYPAHCHINLDARFRGHGTGSALIRRFIEELSRLSVPGVHVSTETDAAESFFAKVGFRRLTTYPLVPMCGEARVFARVLGLRIS
jgi:ribosomal protein S18 acetylase RimI-like enzyme